MVKENPGLSPAVVHGVKSELRNLDYGTEVRGAAVGISNLGVLL